MYLLLLPHNIIEHLYDYELGIIDIGLILPDNLSKDDYLRVLCSDNLPCLRSSKYSNMLCYSNSQYQKNMEEIVEYQEAAGGTERTQMIERQDER